MLQIPAPQQNRLLAALPEEVKLRLYLHLEPVSLALGQVLYESGEALRHVYFPTDSIVSLLYVMESGASAEISVVGNEGLIGIALFMGGESTPSRAIVQSAGLRLSPAGTTTQGRVPSPRRDAFADASLHPVPNHADGPDRGLQPSPFNRATTVPLVAAVARPTASQSSWP